MLRRVVCPLPYSTLRHVSAPQDACRMRGAVRRPDRDGRKRGERARHMSALAYMKWYSGEFPRETRGWSLTQKDIYRELIDAHQTRPRGHACRRRMHPY